MDRIEFTDWVRRQPERVRREVERQVREQAGDIEGHSWGDDDADMRAWREPRMDIPRNPRE